MTTEITDEPRTMLDIALGYQLRGEIAVMDHTGDTKTSWDPENEAEVEAARALFESLRKKGYMIYRVKTFGKRGEQLNSFDPTAAKLIAIPGIVGG